ncbi:cytochrome P450 76T24 [Vitis vinifera]|uniref:cytochrome P450 76T24 n=1 Tax=Vitis vinifera TaxID=29760 RepID=UPI00015CAF03|nr:cytochrome P450 76T24 [Vitis vinifera]|eukprot:XP_002271652.1 PREDICTED: geraniol 8-hydroxylase [Vitis vinifera]
MDYTPLVLLLLLPSFVWLCFHFLILGSTHRKSFQARLPPGPRPLPIIGNLLELGDKPHHSFTTLSKKYGPLMSLKLGSITTIVISSPETAQQVLNKKDQTFSGRTVPNAIQVASHHHFSIGFLPASAHWRNLRKICSMQIFSLQRVDAFHGLRQKVVQQLLDHAHESCSSGRAVDIGRAAFTIALNLLSNTVFSVDLAHYDSNLSQEFKELIWSILVEVGKPNLADFFPGLRLVDPQGIHKRMSVYFNKLFDVFDSFINQRLQLRASSTDNDVLDALLNLNKQHDHELSCNDIRHLLVDLFSAGTDTTSSTIEWAMAELLNNPKAMAKARDELSQVVGKDRIVEESDISKLPYLHAVVKETFRLHPPAPFLLPRKAEMDSEILGYAVPKNAQVIINVWAIGRDSKTWSDPHSFGPERFLECDIDVKGRDFQLIPFGAGRRICPGLLLGRRMVHLVLASLLHSFDWKLEGGMKPEDMDMSETFGFSVRKAQPLRVVPIKP